MSFDEHIASSGRPHMMLKILALILKAVQSLRSLIKLASE